MISVVEVVAVFVAVRVAPFVAVPQLLCNVSPREDTSTSKIGENLTENEKKMIYVQTSKLSDYTMSSLSRFNNDFLLLLLIELTSLPT